MKSPRLIPAITLALLSFVGLSFADPPVGMPAPPLRLQHWLDGPAIEMDELRGRVVLLRWWTDRCPLCEASAPALRALHERFGPEGLVVIGVFHPKPKASLKEARERAKAGAARFGFEFPVALDHDWQALARWWLDGRSRAATSITLLIDRQGVIRYVHPGGEYHRGGGGPHMADHTSCHEALDELERRIAELLAVE